jgi:hypothetical protein
MSRKISVLSWAWSELADIRVNGIISVSCRIFRLPGGISVAYLMFGFAASWIAQAATGRSTEWDSLHAFVSARGKVIACASARTSRLFSVRGNASSCCRREMVLTPTMGLAG